MDQNISDAALSSPDYSLYGPYRPMTPPEEVADAGDTNDPEFGDDAHCGAALHRSVASPVEEEADAGDKEDPEYFKDLWQVQQRKQQMQEIQRIY